MLRPTKLGMQELCQPRCESGTPSEQRTSAGEVGGDLSTDQGESSSKAPVETLFLDEGAPELCGNVIRTGCCRVLDPVRGLHSRRTTVSSSWHRTKVRGNDAGGRFTNLGQCPVVQLKARHGDSLLKKPLSVHRQGIQKKFRLTC